ncbi:FHIPEP family type III secretion protein, partial [Burkholderia pseudomallei]
MQHGMSVSDALTSSTILSIGDGLVAQIPALLSAFGAGFVVTRVGGSGKYRGANIVGELCALRVVRGGTAVLAL